MQLSLIELWNSMGWFAKGIVFVLFGMSVYAAAIAIRKAMDLRRARRATLAFSAPFSKALEEEDFESASGLIEHFTPFDFASGHQRQSMSSRHGEQFSSMIVPVSAAASMIAGTST